MQIRTRLTLYYVLITASLLLISFVMIFFIYKETRSSKFNNSLKNRALTTANLYFKINQVDSTLLKIIDDNNKDQYDFEKITIFESQFKILYSNKKNKSFKHLYYLKILEKKGDFLQEENDFVFLGFNYKFKKKNYYVIASARDSYGLRNYENLKKILFFVFLVILTLLTISGRIFTKKIIEPISDIMNQVDEISPSNLSSRLDKLKNKDELSRLVNTFNEMLERIEDAFKIQKTFTSNAAHELKNPLAMITSQLEVTLLKQRTIEEYQNSCISVLEDIKRLNEITNQLFLITKLSDKSVELETKKIRIDELIWDVRSDYLNQHPQSKIELDLTNLPKKDEQLFFMLNETLMKTCLWNLIENGIKFSKNKTIKIELQLIDSQLKILFLNDGVKIHKEDIPFLFEPFFRSKHALEIKGFGIGLSIVKQITSLYNIEVRHVERNDSFTQFELIF